MEAHPLLGDLKAGDVVELCPNGVFGSEKDTTALVQVNSLKDISAGQGEEGDKRFAPVYLSKLGKGQIVGISWAAWGPVPDAIEEATDGRFYERAALWLAGRALPAKEKQDAEFAKYGVRIKREMGKPDGAIHEVLFSRANRAEDPVLRQLVGFTKLERLYLENGSGLSDEGMKTLGTMTTLKTLQLTRSKITDVGVEEIKKLTQLEWLDLTDSAISDASVEHLKTLGKLRWLKMKRTKVTERGFAELQGGLPECRISR
jgi:hypothetical protein